VYDDLYKVWNDFNVKATSTYNYFKNITILRKFISGFVHRGVMVYNYFRFKIRDFKQVFLKNDSLNESKNFFLK
jgi:hypothetical protein